MRNAPPPDGGSTDPPIPPRRRRMLIGLALAALIVVGLVWFALTHTETDGGGPAAQRSAVVPLASGSGTLWSVDRRRVPRLPVGFGGPRTSRG